jgi:Zn finger protein HypA/HybF involved in hydrogenase expression
MHESRLVTDLVGEAVRIAELNESDRIDEMQVSIGALSHVDPLSLESHLQEATTGTLAEDATFTVTKSVDRFAPDALDVRLVSMRIGEN